MFDSWDRPIINIPKTKSERILDTLGYSAYFGSISFLVIIWRWLPNEIPAKFNGLGEIDRWGSKWELLLLPILGSFILLIFQMIEKYPTVHMYPKRFNKSNAKQFYLASRKLCNQSKNMISLTFALIIFYSISIALGWIQGLGIFFIVIIVIGLGIPILLGIIRFIRIK